MPEAHVWERWPNQWWWAAPCGGFGTRSTKDGAEDELHNHMRDCDRCWVLPDA